MDIRFRDIYFLLNQFIILKQIWMQNPNFVVELFIKTLTIKHKLTFEKDKEEYFRVLFDTYLNGQGNAAELRDYIAAGVDNPDTINIIANEVIEWQSKAEELKVAEAAKKKEKDLEKEKIQQFVADRTKKLKEEAVKEKQQKKEKKEKGEAPPPRKKVKANTEKVEGGQGQNVEAVEGEVEKNQQNQKQELLSLPVDKKGLKQQLLKKGTQKCKFYPYCKNIETCQFFHPSQRCTFFPHCRYGQNCLYEHEACKFKEKCMRNDCPYIHPYKKTNPIQEMMKTMMAQNPNGFLNKHMKKKFPPKNKNEPRENTEQK